MLDPFEPFFKKLIACNINLDPQDIDFYTAHKVKIKQLNENKFAIAKDLESTGTRLLGVLTVLQQRWLSLWGH